MLLMLHLSYERWLQHIRLQMWRASAILDPDLTALSLVAGRPQAEPGRAPAQVWNGPQQREWAKMSHTQRSGHVPIDRNGLRPFTNEIRRSWHQLAGRDSLLLSFGHWYFVSFSFRITKVEEKVIFWKTLTNWKRLSLSFFQVKSGFFSVLKR